MKYKIRIDAWIADDADLPAVKTALQNLAAKLTNITGANGVVEKASIAYHKCYHDEGKPCPEDKVIWEKS